MSRVQTLSLVGILVIASPFIGLPLSVLSYVLPVLGLAVVVIAISLRAPAKPQPSSYDQTQNRAS